MKILNHIKQSLISFSNLFWWNYECAQLICTECIGQLEAGSSSLVVVWGDFGMLEYHLEICALCKIFPAYEFPGVLNFLMDKMVVHPSYQWWPARRLECCIHGVRSKKWGGYDIRKAHQKGIFCFFNGPRACVKNGCTCPKYPSAHSPPPPAL